MFLCAPQRLLSPFLMGVGRKTHLRFISLRFISLNLLLQSSFLKKRNPEGYIVITLPCKIICNGWINLINFLSKYITIEGSFPPHLNHLTSNKDFAHLWLSSNSIWIYSKTRMSLSYRAIKAITQPSTCFSKDRTDNLSHLQPPTRHTTRTIKPLSCLNADCHHLTFTVVV